MDQDGPALVGDPDIGFEGLRQFGPTLIHHAQLKVREGITNQNFMMVVRTNVDFDMFHHKKKQMYCSSFISLRVIIQYCRIVPE